MSKHIETISRILKLTPYQAYILSRDAENYNFRELRKFGNLLLAPRRCQHKRGFADAIESVFAGPRADLIGLDRMLVSDQRGIKIYPGGIYRAYDSMGKQYFADGMGERIYGRAA